MKGLVFQLVAIFITIQACTTNNYNDSADEKNVSNIVPLNTNSGYTINPYTRDSIAPLLNSSGDTLITGKPIEFDVSKYDTLTLDPPLIVEAKFRTYSTLPMVRNLLQGEAKARINLDSLLKAGQPKSKSKSYILSAVGDTISTGVARAAKFKTSKVTFSEPIRAKNPVFTPKARHDLRVLDTEQGLPIQQINSLTEDGNGNLWIGSGGSGAIKYDGEWLQTFSKENGFPLIINELITTQDGTIWMASNEGVYAYNGTGLKKLTGPHVYKQEEVHSIFESASGDLWIGTANNGVILLRDNQMTRLSVNEGLASNSIWKMYEDSKNRIWICTRKGVSVYNGTSFTTLAQENGFWAREYYAVAEDLDGNIWIGSNKGIFKLEGKLLYYFGSEQQYPPTATVDVIRTSSGAIWFCTQDMGVLRIKDHEIQHFIVGDGLKSNWINDVYEDSRGMIWFSSFTGGLHLFNPTSFIKKTTTALRDDYPTLSISKDSDNNIWLGTHSSGLFKYEHNQDSFRHYDFERNVIDFNIAAQTQTTNNKLLFGHERGFSLVEDDKIYGYKSDPVFAMLKDKKNTLWLGSLNGSIYQYAEQSLISISTNNDFKKARIDAIIEASDGEKWIASRGGGLIRMDDERVIIYSEREGLLSNYVQAVVEDPHHNLWVGSAAGLSRFDGQTFTHFTEKEGLNTTRVTDLLIDKDGNLWITGLNGIHKLASNQLNKRSPHFEHCDQSYGLDSKSFLSVLQDHTGKMWFGGTNFTETLQDADAFTSDSLQTQLKISSININDHYFDFGNLPDSVSKNIQFDSVTHFDNQPHQPQIDWRYNTIRLNYATLSKIPYEKRQYRYRLHGLQENWQTTSESTAVFQRLPGGNYTFEASMKNPYTGAWGTPVSYSFTISTPWFQTWWFHALVGLTLVLIGILINNRRVRQLQKRKKQLEQTVKERTAEILNQKEEIEAQKEAIEGQNEEITSQNEELLMLNEELNMEREELSATNEELLHQIYRFEQLTKEKDTLIQVINQHVAAPFRKLRDSLKTLKSVQDPIAKNQQIHSIENDLAGTEKLITDIYDENSLSQGSFKLQPTELDIKATVDRIISELCEQKNQLTATLPSVFMTSDAELLGSLLRNLIELLKTKGPSVAIFGEENENYIDLLFTVRLDDEVKNIKNLIDLFPASLSINRLAQLRVSLITAICKRLDYSLEVKPSNQQRLAVKLKLSKEINSDSSVAPTQKLMEDDEARNIFAQIKKAFEDEKLHADADLTISQVAEHLDVYSKKISYAVNLVSGQNFSNFMNQYRIEEAKRMLVDADYAHLSYLAIGYEAGFNSKSSFYSTFKKMTGMSPKEYINQHGKSNGSE